MKQALRYLPYVLTLIGIFVSMNTKADMWESPAVKTYYSENREFKLIVTPKIEPLKYYAWTYYKDNKHPQTKKILRDKKKFMQRITAQDTIVIRCTAELYRMQGSDSTLVWKRTLLNDVCPVNAIIANDGSSIATFDNWYFRGYGVNVFVVYDEKGDAKKTYKLEEITPFALNDYPRSISSIYWSEIVEYTKNDKIKIVFKTDDNREATKVYNTKKLEFERE